MENYVQRLGPLTARLKNTFEEIQRLDAPISDSVGNISVGSFAGSNSSDMNSSNALALRTSLQRQRLAALTNHLKQAEASASELCADLRTLVYEKKLEKAVELLLAAQRVGIIPPFNIDSDYATEVCSSDGMASGKQTSEGLSTIASSLSLDQDIYSQIENEMASDMVQSSLSFQPNSEHTYMEDGLTPSIIGEQSWEAVLDVNPHYQSGFSILDYNDYNFAQSFAPSNSAQTLGVSSASASVPVSPEQGSLSRSRPKHTLQNDSLIPGFRSQSSAMQLNLAELRALGAYPDVRSDMYHAVMFGRHASQSISKTSDANFSVSTVNNHGRSPWEHPWAAISQYIHFYCTEDSMSTQSSQPPGREGTSFSTGLSNPSNNGTQGSTVSSDYFQGWTSAVDAYEVFRRFNRGEAYRPSDPQSGRLSLFAAQRAARLGLFSAAGRNPKRGQGTYTTSRFRRQRLLQLNYQMQAQLQSQVQRFSPSFDEKNFGSSGKSLYAGSNVVNQMHSIQRHPSGLYNGSSYDMSNETYDSNSNFEKNFDDNDIWGSSSRNNSQSSASTRSSPYAGQSASAFDLGSSSYSADPSGFPISGVSGAIRHEALELVTHLSCQLVQLMGGSAKERIYGARLLAMVGLGDSALRVFLSQISMSMHRSSRGLSFGADPLSHLISLCKLVVSVMNVTLADIPTIFGAVTQNLQWTQPEQYSSVSGSDNVSVISSRLSSITAMWIMHETSWLASLLEKLVFEPDYAPLQFVKCIRAVFSVLDNLDDVGFNISGTLIELLSRSIVSKIERFFRVKELQLSNSVVEEVWSARSFGPSGSQQTSSSSPSTATATATTSTADATATTSTSTSPSSTSPSGNSFSLTSSALELYESGRTLLRDCFALLDIAEIRSHAPEVQYVLVERFCSLFHGYFSVTLSMVSTVVEKLYSSCADNTLPNISLSSYQVYAIFGNVQGLTQILPRFAVEIERKSGSRPPRIERLAEEWRNKLRRARHSFITAIAHRFVYGYRPMALQNIPTAVCGPNSILQWDATSVRARYESVPIIPDDPDEADVSKEFLALAVKTEKEIQTASMFGGPPLVRLTIPTLFDSIMSCINNVPTWSEFTFGLGGAQQIVLDLTFFVNSCISLQHGRSERERLDPRSYEDILASLIRRVVRIYACSALGLASEDFSAILNWEQLPETDVIKLVATCRPLLSKYHLYVDAKSQSQSQPPSNSKSKSTSNRKDPKKDSKNIQYGKKSLRIDSSDEDEDDDEDDSDYATNIANKVLGKLQNKNTKHFSSSEDEDEDEDEDEEDSDDDDFTYNAKSKPQPPKSTISQSLTADAEKLKTIVNRSIDDSMALIKRSDAFYQQVLKNIYCAKPSPSDLYKKMNGMSISSPTSEKKNVVI